MGQKFDRFGSTRYTINFCGLISIYVYNVCILMYLNLAIFILVNFWKSPKSPPPPNVYKIFRCFVSEKKNPWLFHCILFLKNYYKKISFKTYNCDAEINPDHGNNLNIELHRMHLHVHIIKISFNIERNFPTCHQIYMTLSWKKTYRDLALCLVTELIWDCARFQSTI